MDLHADLNFNDMLQKKIIYLATVLMMVLSCTDIRDTDPYEGGLYVLNVTAQMPDDGFDCEGIEVRVEDVNAGGRYIAQTNEEGMATFSLPNGLYRISMNGRQGDLVFNAVTDRVVLSGEDISVSLELAVSKAGSIVIKEVYCGGCKKFPMEGDYQADQYIILHNNDYQVQYLDSLCLGTLSPYNSSAVNPWVSKDELTGETKFQDFVPIIQAVWQFPGDGDDFPLQPGEDAVICLRGAIDHASQYPMSVNLNKPGYFVCYNSTYFPNTNYHPAPGNLISQDRYLNVVVKTGQANAYTMSLSSPAVVIFRAQSMSIQEFVNIPDNITQVPGSKVDNVVKVPLEWVMDAVEVFDGSSSNNQKRLSPLVDVGYVELSDTFLGHTLMRHTDEEASAMSGYEVLVDTNNSLQDFYETSIQSLHE